jgi:NAD(P)-dependent dehydrogenase (short-subunit alcohol dehydrogenase family)
MSSQELFDLTGKVGLVTGGNSGLGFGFASGIAKCGGDVVIWGRRKDKNDEAAEHLRAMGAGRVHTQAVDVSSEEQVVSGMAEAIEVMGRLDGAVVNAGSSSMSPFHEMTTQIYEDLLAVSQHGGFFTAREAVRHMKARADAGDPGGSLIFCGSLTVFQGHAGLEHYAAAKGAMASMMHSIAAEYGRDGIRANMVCAGLMHSGMVDAVPEEFLATLTAVLEEKSPVPRWGYPSDLEGITAYLMSDCSSYHTGDIIVIDGGQSRVSLT